MQNFQRSHAQTEEGNGSASPSWNAHPHESAHGSFSHLNRPFHLDDDRARIHDHSNAFRFHYRRDPSIPSHTANDRPASAGAARPNTSGLHLPGLGDMASSAPRRFAGDGFDYRRPAGSSREQAAAPVDLSGDDDDEDMQIDLSRDEDVIDLTADDSGYGASQDGNSGGRRNRNEEANAQPSNQSGRTNNGPRRLPRGMDIIIDLDNGDEEWRLASPVPAEPGSPDIEFISSRPLDQPHRAHQPGLGRSNSDGDEVEFVRANPLPEDEVRRRQTREMNRTIGAIDLLGNMHGSFNHLRAQVDRFHAQMNRTVANFRQGPVPPPRGAPRARGHVHVGFAAPGMLDFDMVAFDLGIEPAPRAQPPPATYEAPSEAPEGFTRSPEEEGDLVCPNCEEELCVGDDDVKKQVWIVKTCGHVRSTRVHTYRSVLTHISGLLWRMHSQSIY
jgi:hypothetical protein